MDLIPMYLIIYARSYRYIYAMMSGMASQITGVFIVCSTVVWGAGKKKNTPKLVSLAFVWVIHRWSVDSPHKGQVTRKIFFHLMALKHASKVFVLDKKVCFMIWRNPSQFHNTLLKFESSGCFSACLLLLWNYSAELNITKATINTKWSSTQANGSYNINNGVGVLN